MPPSSLCTWHPQDGSSHERSPRPAATTALRVQASVFRRHGQPHPAAHRALAALLAKGA